MTEPVCLHFHDIYENPKDKPKDLQKEIRRRNFNNELIYKAVRYVLKNDFDLFKSAAASSTTPTCMIPVEPSDFAPEKLSDNERVQFIGILGILQADNWEDPRNGKEKPSLDDVFVAGDDAGSTAPPDGGPAITRFVIDRRFIDAVVEAVKEYTASSKLWSNVYQMMRAEASEGSDEARTSTAV